MWSIELSPQQIVSCTPSTGTYGSDGCDGGFTEGAYEYVQSAPGLANSFFIPYQQSLTASDATKPCMTAQVAAINGADEMLQGGYAQVSGYTYATPPCTSGACTSQDLDTLAASLEETLISICVNAENWNDYIGGVMSSAQCGGMDADDQDHCVMATGFNSAPTPYWIVRNSWSSTWGEYGYIYLDMSTNTCGLADDATIPTVELYFSAEQKAAAAGTAHNFSDGADSCIIAFTTVAGGKPKPNQPWNEKDTKSNMAGDQEELKNKLARNRGRLMFSQTSFAMKKTPNQIWLETRRSSRTSKRATEDAECRVPFIHAFMQEAHHLDHVPGHVPSKLFAMLYSRTAQFAKLLTSGGASMRCSLWTP